MKYRLWVVALAGLAAGCGGRDRPAALPAAVPTDWRQVATAADRDRLRNWRDTWMLALGKARADGQGAAIAAQGRLFDFDRVLGHPVPPPGDYRCRIFKFGTRTAGLRQFREFPPFDCRVDREGSVTSFYKISGTQRPVGLIFGDPAGHAIFLGTLLLGDETRAIDYGSDRMRDMAGLVDRVGEQRWRIALPAPAFDSMLDVIELVSAKN